jgi:hypothetical protein
LNKFRFRRFINHDLFPFLILGLGMIIIHVFAPIPVADDIYFNNRINSLFDWSFYRFRYFDWSSRILIEFFILALLRLPSLVWRIINPGFIVLLGLSIQKLLGLEKNRIANWFVVFLLLIFPFREMLAGGWITISVNYIWPISFGLCFLLTTIKFIEEKKISFIEYCLSIFLLIITVNQEIMALILLIILLTAAVYTIINKKPKWLIFLSLGICMISIVFIFASPGNQNRRNVETMWFVDFNYISIVEKIEIGLSATLAQHLFRFNFIFLFLSLLLFLYINEKYCDCLYKVLALFPLVVGFVFNQNFHFLFGRIFPHLTEIDPFLSKYGLITIGNFTQIKTIIPYFILYFTTFIIIVLLYLVFENTQKCVFAIGVFLLGLLSRLILSFSPTIWASGLRTHLFFMIAMIMCCVMIFHELSLCKPKRFMDNLIIFAGFSGALTVLNALMAIQ